MPAPGEVLAEIKDNPLGSTLSLRRDRKIDAGDLNDLHIERKLSELFRGQKKSTLNAFVSCRPASDRVPSRPMRSNHPGFPH